MSDSEAWIVRELDKIGRTVEKTAEDVEDVKVRVTRLETSNKVIASLIALMIAGIPVLFTIWDRVTH